MSIWEIAVALVPTLLIAAAGIAVIEHLRISSEGDRYKHREYRADEERDHSNGSRNGRRRGQR
ncbi:MAG TPA: hypothetical protein VKF14_13740 [Candidatus Dormibacteraeota bacterium]|nr:hypothetical protein [Candidatus Dormibacteraeota bacterium]